MPIWPALDREANQDPGDPVDRQYVDRQYIAACGLTGSAPMREATLGSLIERYTKNEFGTAVWPHLFRDCLLTSVAVDHPMTMSATLLGHVKLDTNQKH